MAITFTALTISMFRYFIKKEEVPRAKKNEIFTFEKFCIFSFEILISLEVVITIIFWAVIF